MWDCANESSMFPSWFRTLSLAYLSYVLRENAIASLSLEIHPVPRPAILALKKAL